MQRHSTTQAIRCEHVHSVLEEYLAGELNVDTQMAIETHLAACQDCQNELDFALEVSDALQELPKPQPPPEIFDQVAAYVQSHPKPTAQGWSDSLKRVLRTLSLRSIAAGVVTACLIGLVTFSAYQHHQQSLQIEQATYELSYALGAVRHAMQKTELAIYEGLPSNEVMEAPRQTLLFALDEVNTTTNDHLSPVIRKSLAIFNKLNWKEIDK